MRPYRGDAFLYIKSNDDNLEVRNYTKTSDEQELPMCNLNDFFTNNIGFEMSKISVLQLENCDISEIPQVVQKLNLKQLILARNKLVEIPSCFYSGLNALQLLDLSHNLIKGFDIEPACSCTIVTLRLANNQIHNFPHWILTVRCPYLVEVDYSKNFVTKLDMFQKLNVKKLEMCNAHLLDDDFLFLKRIETLEYLDVSNDKSGDRDNRFRDINKLFVKSKWKALKVLKLNNLMLSIVPKGIFWIASLTELQLINCDLHWIPPEVQYLTNLTTLDVSENSICSLPRELALPNISILRAPFNYIDSVPEFAALEILDLYDNNLVTVPGFARIKFVDFEKNYFDTSLHVSYETYKDKRDRFRQAFDYARTNGPCAPPPDLYPSDDDNAESDEGFETSTSEFYDIIVENECWDEEKPQLCLQRNPDVTSSDDEWNGKEETKIKSKEKKVAAWFDANEDWIFCDAE